MIKASRPRPEIDKIVMLHSSRALVGGGHFGNELGVTVGEGSTGGTRH
jgi:hypothetical protein